MSSSRGSEEAAGPDIALNLVDMTESQALENPRKISIGDTFSTADEVFRFLDLPRELRDQIYDCLLITEYVEKETSNPYYDTHSEGSRPMPDDYPGPGTVGTLRSQSVLKQSLAYSVSILRINRQIYEEALATFGENKWILINVNNAGYGSALKEHGFPVVPCRELEFIGKNCVLNVGVSFLSLMSSSLDDTFIISAGAADQLVRALWTTNGVHEMSVRLGVLADAAFHLEMRTVF